LRRNHREDRFGIFFCGRERQTAGVDDDIRQLLLRDGLIKSAEATIVPLTGGVSSEIYRVEDGGRVLAVKRALRKLKVADDWFVDLSRNASEVEYLRCVAGIAPASVPVVHFASAEDGYFAMEYLGDGFSNWKTLLLEGVCRQEHARMAAQLLAKIHRQTWADASVRARFETTENFRQLRLDPYLLTTGRRHPDLESHFVVEVERIATTRLCLIHGDYSPKNMLIQRDRFVLLDCEVAWFGDPTFDVAFLLNHFFLKAIHGPAQRHEYAMLVKTFMANYLDEMGAHASQVQANVPGLLLMLMLARVDGKSPVEYLCDSEKKKNLIRDFTRKRIAASLVDLPTLLADWLRALEPYAQD
jgi:aminoglycoside phosphotransferase (APT) family kinase protein